MTKQKNKRIVNNFILALGIIVIIVPVALSLSFTSSPSINGGLTVYTDNDLSCAWTASADTLSVNISWYKNDVLQFTFEGATSPNILNLENTTKADDWICEVVLINATNNYAQNVSTTIQNTAPITPVLYDETQSILTPYNYSLIEDETTIFYINSSDADGDTLIYSLAFSGEGLCNILDSSTGMMSCTATHLIITNSSNPSFENPIVMFITPIASASNPYSASGDENRSFYLVPRNDQATFANSYNNLTIEAENSFKLIINGTDEELDYPLNFTMASDLIESFGDVLVLDYVNSSVINLTFNNSQTAPLNAHSGNWTIYLNITDNESSNTTRQPTQIFFGLEITTTNHPPNFTTSLNNTNGTQGILFEAYIYANDSDSSDLLSFGISEPTGSEYDCDLSLFPWNITTVDGNATNASGMISMTLTNDHVVCRYVNITVSDDLGARDSQMYFINVTNTNDAPIMYEIGANGNISNQTTYLYVNAQYAVNASDNDALTYERNITGNLTYSTNHSSYFSINSASGVISYTPNSSYLGNWSVNVSVSDGYLQDSKIMYVEILNNTAPYLNISPNNLLFQQNDNIILNFTGEELNNQTMYLELISLTNFSSLIYNATIISTNYASGTNMTSWQIDMTEIFPVNANNNVGEHLVLINLTDNFNASQANYSTGVLNFTITNENDAPFFDKNFDNVSDPINFGDVVVNKTFTYLLNVTDFDLYLDVEENLTFNYSNATSGLSNINLTKIDNNSAHLSFFVNTHGFKNITLRVFDANNSVDEQNVSFEALSPSTNPVIISIKPFYDIVTNTTNNTFVSSSNYPTRNVSIVVSENDSVVFDAIINNDTSIAGNYLTYYWYVDDVLNKSVIDPIQELNSNLTYYFDFFSEGIHNVTLFAEDTRFSNTSWHWIVNVTNLNRNPIYYQGTLENLTVNRTSEWSNYFSYRNLKQRFYDADDDLNNDGVRTADFNESTSLNYIILNADLCSLAEFTVTGDNLQIRPSNTGQCVVRFNATDPYGASITSEDIYISVIGSEPSSGSVSTSSSSGGSSTRTQVVTVPLEEEVDSPVPIKIIAPDQVTTYINQTIEIPIELQNTWTESIRLITLSGISLNATFANENNVSLDFTNTYFTAIPVGQSVKTKLIVTNYRTQGPFEIEIYAHVTSPEFTDSATIFINSFEQSSEGDEVKSKVTFAKDMLSENSECRELNDLLNRAEEEMDKSNYAEAANLVNAVINGCKFLINKNEIFRNEQPSIIQQSFDFLGEHSEKLVIGAGVLTFLVILVYVVATIKHFVSDYKGKKEE